MSDIANKKSWIKLGEFRGMRGSNNCCRLIQVGDKFFRCEQRKIVEYCLTTQQIKDIEYPKDVIDMPVSICCCLFNNKIYIFHHLFNDNNHYLYIVQFDPFTYKFQQKLKNKKKLTDIGFDQKCVVVYDTIHLMGHTFKDRNIHIIYRPNQDDQNEDNDNDKKQETIKCFKNDTINSFCKKDENSIDRLDSFGIINYKNRLYRIGGYNCDTNKSIDTFAVSNIIKQDEYENIKWTIKDEQKLPKKLHGFGYILYKNVIVIFGGKEKGGVYSDTIYALNIDKDDGQWEEIKDIKCPLHSEYLAILTHSNNDELLVSGYARSISNSTTIIIPAALLSLIFDYYAFKDDIHLCQLPPGSFDVPMHYSLIHSKQFLSKLTSKK